MEAVKMKIKPLRLGASFKPPTLFLEFQEVNGATNHHAIVLTEKALAADAKDVLQNIRLAFPHYYTAEVAEEQLLTTLKVLQSGKVPAAVPDMQQNNKLNIKEGKAPIPSQAAAPSAHIPVQTPPKAKAKDELDDELAELLGELTDSPIDAHMKTEHSTVSSTGAGAQVSPQTNYGAYSRSTEHKFQAETQGTNVSTAMKSSTTQQPNDLALIATIGDLQRAGPAALQAAKAKMEVVFEKHRVKPGDEEYIYDKRVEFAPQETSEWDD